MQKEHVLGGLLAVIVIVGVQIATQLQMQKITQQVEMVQENLSATVVKGSVKQVEKVFEEGSIKLDRVIESYIMGKTSLKELTPFQQKLVSEIFEGKSMVDLTEDEEKKFKDWWCRNFYASGSWWSELHGGCTEGSQTTL